MMIVRSVLWSVMAASVVMVPVGGGLEQLAREGQWQRLLDTADRRSEQLPLQPGEAFLAAFAARSLGDDEAELRHLSRAVEDGPLQELARLELAQAIVDEEPDRAVELVLGFLRRAPSWTVRSHAVSVAIDGLDAGVDEATRGNLNRMRRYLPRSLRRELDLGLARTDGPESRRNLVRLLQASTRDTVALEAARLLQAEPNLSVDEQYIVAKSLYRHALYDEATAIFEALDGVSSRRIPSWELAFLAGRCDFRRGRWTEAARHYETALDRRSSAEGRAEIGVHLARAHELNGRLDLAVEAARRAVVARTTDDRRLFLARLRLRLDQPDKARAGLAKVKGRTARSRGEMMLALYDIKKGRTAEARSRLEGVRRRPWYGPAAVIAAGLALDAGDHDAALRGLEGAASSLDSYWAGKARAQMMLLPHELTEEWRQEMAARVSAGDSRSRRKALAVWSTLEFDPVVVARLRGEVTRTVELDTTATEPDIPPGLAHDLWSVGLPSEAVRWDPRGMPVGDVNQATWSARQFAELALPWQAIRTADGAWRMAGGDIPTRGYPLALQRSLHPLPDPDLVWRTAVERAVPWSLMAGVAREESRWRPTVVSVVGARGLMQLMPGTATAVATNLGLTPPTLEELFDPGVSLTLGGAEINRLLAVFEGQLEPSVAAYNAGEAQAKLWLDQCGSPCRSEWYVATITFTATNGYTRDVIASAQTYVDLYGATPHVISERSVRSWEPEGPATAQGR